MSENKECWALFHGKGGYAYQNTEANELLTIGAKYKIIGGEIGRSSTTVILEGQVGYWNSVMFDFNHDSAPLEKVYLGVPRNLISAATKSYPAEMDGNTYYSEITEQLRMLTLYGLNSFLKYAKEKEWITDRIEDTDKQEVTFCNRGVQDSWELWKAARKF